MECLARKALALDVDGTIWDAQSWYADALAGFTRKPKASFLDELGTGASVVTLASNHDISRARLLTALRQADDGPALYPGVAVTLTRLRESEVPLALVTSLSAQVLEMGLDRNDLGGAFDVVIHPGNCTARKPSPTPLLRALDALGVDTQDTLYVGDSQVDADCAERAGVDFAWASYGHGTVEPPPAMTLGRFADVERLL